jgi:uncharacterized peroxidase-related enzyme
MDRISRFPIDPLPADVEERLRPVIEKTGFVPNVFLAMAHRPGQLRAFLDYYDAVMEAPSGLTKAEKEMVVVATSAANDCLYCVVAHGAILRIRAKDSELADRIAVNWRGAPVEPRQRTMLEFAVKLARTPEEVGEADLERMREAGFDDEDIWDIGAITALFALSNRMAHLLDLQPNPEFFTMGR